jgi:hypothetical protein
MKKKITQLQTADAAVDAIAVVNRTAIWRLVAVVEAASITGPERPADQSIDRDVWHLYNDIAESGRALVGAIDRFMLTTKRRP